MQTIKETCYRGTRILLGNEKRDMINELIRVARFFGYTEISIPVIQASDVFAGKVGEENNNMMFGVTDRGGRDLCLAPEYTAVVQRLASTTFAHNPNTKLFYVQECFRGERPQAGRYRQFTQFGVEVLNPTKNYMDELLSLVRNMFNQLRIQDYVINTDAVRGLDYYKGGRGFEVMLDALGSSKQICGGGEYDGGVGFALGVDRLLAYKYQ